MSDLDGINQQVEEMFALPINLTTVATLDGYPLFSSDSLKLKYLKAIESTKISSFVSEPITSLVDHDKILPVFMNKGLFSFTMFKIFAPSGYKMVRGFYASKYNKIFLLIDNNVTFGFASNTFLGELTKHECMHMIAFTNPAFFRNLFKSELESYYMEYFYEYFKLSSRNINLQPLIVFLYKNYEMKAGVRFPTESFIRYRNLLDKLFRNISTLDKNTFDQYLTNYEEAVRLFCANFNSFLHNVGTYRNVLIPMYKAYRTAFGAKEVPTFCIQETIFPSEIIAVFSTIQPINPKIKKAIIALA